MTIQEKQNEIISEFEVFEDWTQKYEYIIDLGKDLAPLDPTYKNDENLVKGCQSRVWLYPEVKDGKIFFHADSDAIITKGLVSLVVQVFSGRTAEEINRAEIYFIDKIGLKQHLSPTRANGLLSMIQKIKNIAQSF